jgi:meiotically up-regulated gene 157 (Mug157) protein
MIWPMATTVYALTSQSEAEIVHAVALLKHASAGSGFMHESFNCNDAAKFTRKWFAWDNSLFGEFGATVAERHPQLLKVSSSDSLPNRLTMYGRRLTVGKGVWKIFSMKELG